MCNGHKSRTFKSVLAFHFIKEEFLCFCLGINFRLASQTVSGRFLILHIPTLSKCVLLCKLLMGYTESIFLGGGTDFRIRTQVARLAFFHWSLPPIALKLTFDALLCAFVHELWVITLYHSFIQSVI